MTSPLITIRETTVALSGKPVLRDINWELGPAQHWLIAGPNGSGKSTFLRLIHGDVWPAPGLGERIYRLGDDVQTTAVDVKKHIALVSPESQERYLVQDWRLTGRDVMQTGFAQSDFLYVNLTPLQNGQVDSLGRQLGIASLLERDVQTLSTGELRKVLIARALVGHPRVLLLDEVCDGLDATFRRETLAFIDRIARQGTQIVYTTHRADEPLSAITHGATFENGRITRQGPRSDAGVMHPRSHCSVSLIGKARARKSTASAGKKENDRTKRPLILMEGADVFLDRQRVLRDIHWQWNAGEHWVVLGANGAGKTTFLKLIASDVYPAYGARMQRFEFTARHTIWDLRHRIGCVSPLLQTQYQEQLTGAEVVATGFFSSIGLMEKVTPRQRQKVDRLMERFGVSGLACRPLLEMSFGERRKMLLLRALVHDPKLLILDEPFDGLDFASRKEFAVSLQQIAQGGTQLLIVTHHLDDLPPCMTRGLLLDAGRVAVLGDWPSIRAHPQVVELFGP